MIYLNINYIFHLFLQSKHRILIQIAFILFVYMTFYGYNYAICMNNTNNIIEAPVNEVINSQAEDLRREISAYVDSHASLLEEIDRKNQFIQNLLESSKRKSSQILELRRQNGALGRTIHELREEAADLRDIANSNYNAYKKQCIASGRAGQHVHELKQELFAAKQEIKNLQTSNKLLTSAITLLKK